MRVKFINGVYYDSLECIARVNYINEATKTGYRYQYRYRSMFLVNHGDIISIFSYRTQIGYYVIKSGELVFTTHKYSATTSKQMTMFIHENEKHIKSLTYTSEF